jgi:hypothetical protein
MPIGRHVVRSLTLFYTLFSGTTLRIAGLLFFLLSGFSIFAQAQPTRIARQIEEQNTVFQSMSAIAPMTSFHERTSATDVAKQVTEGATFLSLQPAFPR